MHECKFKLKKNTALQIAGLSLPAFSGEGEFRNRRTHMCLPDQGPIPVGTYYILDRQSGGRLAPVYQMIKGDWFALYAKDRVIDDQRYCAGLLRGQFRLHAKGPRGVSKGCVTIESASDFELARHLLKTTSMEPIPGSELMAYGMLYVS